MLYTRMSALKLAESAKMWLEQCIVKLKYGKSEERVVKKFLGT